MYVRVLISIYQNQIQQEVQDRGLSYEDGAMHAAQRLQELDNEVCHLALKLRLTDPGIHRLSFD